MVRCKVLIDKISRIKIFHHAVKINLDDLATLNITAFDDEENVFSSLVGLQFSWQLLPKSLEAESMHRLIHVPLKETPLGDCVSGFCEDLDVQLQLEDKGLGSNLYVVKGIGIGHEIVKAKLLEPQLEHLEDEITLTVAEAMSLDPPSPIFVTVGSLIYYSLRVIHGNTHQGGVRLHEWLFRLLRSRSTSLLRRRSLLLSDRKLRHFHWK
ncbi:nuclear pore complex protein GP210-like isoform X1 [Dendrobium catenatum]|uniref:nuclear pore complex protein GP210-like isoform X1 n=1 Tax=Dendrobium catenatum TaxID=906689 RepID=UPI0009F31EEC|nr:nuclear pore complex protein GP210-like isoform X1 [Dendrobium catenatum]